MTELPAHTAMKYCSLLKGNRTNEGCVAKLCEKCSLPYTLHCFNKNLADCYIRAF